MHWQTKLRMLLLALASAGLVACGGGGGNGGSGNAGLPPAPTPIHNQPGAPSLTGDIRTDGHNWINYRRGQLGVPGVLRQAQLDQAAQAHSDYQRMQNTAAHEEVAGRSGFTGITAFERIQAAGYLFGAPYAYGEVIAGASNSNGFTMVEVLITAIYHRFVIFEPRYKEVGVGAATALNGYTFFTANFAARDGFGPGIGPANLVVWPYEGQTNVPANFFSDQESPDPVPSANEVGYPVSVHGDLNGFISVKQFSLRPRGGAELPVRLLAAGAEQPAPNYAAAVVPLSPLQARTTYEASFSGTVNGVAFNKTWSFTTR